MPKREAPAPPATLVEVLQHLLERAAGDYARQHMVLEGSTVLPAADFADDALEAWRDAVRSGVVVPGTPAFGGLVDQALGRALLRNPLKHVIFLEEDRKAPLLRDFGKALRRDRLTDTGDLSLREWMAHVVDMPKPGAGSTPDDVRLRELVEAIPEAERATHEELVLEDAGTLRDLSPLTRPSGLRVLRFPRGGRFVVDLSPLAHLQWLRVLQIDSEWVVDLAPLASLTRLQMLSGAFPRVRDISPLVGLAELELLNLHGGERIEDLSPLAGLSSLRTFDLSSERLVDGAPLSRLVGLRQLTLHARLLQSVEPLRALTSLVELKLFDCRRLPDLTAIDALKELEKLDISLSGQGRPAPSLHLPKLRELVQYELNVRALPSLEGLPALEELTVWLAELETLAGLEHGHCLRKLTLGGSKTLTDLRPLAGLTALEELSLDEFEKVEDLSPLAALRSLKRLIIGGARVRDLSPLANLTELRHLELPGNPLTSIEPLARLPNLERLSVHQCYDLESIRPLVSCTKLVSLDVEYCDRLRGPKNLADLRAAAKATPAKTYPSAGVVPTRKGQVAAFDTRNHLPRHPPEGWSLPERQTLAGDAGGAERRSEDAYFIQGEGLTLAVKLWSRNDQHMLSVQLGTRDGRATDKQVARALRRFRACDPFVETEHEGLQVEGFPELRAFIAKAHAASPDTWGVVRERRPYLRVEAPDEAAVGEERSAEADVRNHLPYPLPEGWSERAARNATPDTAVVLETPYAEVTVWLLREDGSDVHQLYVGLIPRPKNATLGDAAAVDVVSRFRRRGAFQERSAAQLPQAPGMRLFFATPR
jgi:Leucine-rich repeat (LRR) protein